MGGDALCLLLLLLLLLLLFISNKMKQQRGKILFPQATQTVFNLFLFLSFLLLRLTLDFVQEHLTESMLPHLCPGWNAHAKCTRIFVHLFWFGLVF